MWINIRCHGTVLKEIKITENKQIMKFNEDFRELIKWKKCKIRRNMGGNS